jgi:hypothetical protein
MAIFFGLEIAMKSYAYGLRRAFSQVDWVLKIEFFNQPVIWTIFFFFIFGGGDENYQNLVNLLSTGILIRSLRVSSVLNEI